MSGNLSGRRDARPNKLVPSSIVRTLLTCLAYKMGIIDEEEFMSDLFCFTSFTLDSGAASWDPTAWKIGKEFSAKWGYLFY
jgi:hypothetical protein